MNVNNLVFESLYFLIDQTYEMGKAIVLFDRKILLDENQVLFDYISLVSSNFTSPSPFNSISPPANCQLISCISTSKIICP